MKGGGGGGMHAGLCERVVAHSTHTCKMEVAVDIAVRVFKGF